MSNETTASQRTYNLLSQTRVDHAGIPFISNVDDCIICCQPSDVFGIAKCQHPICMECCIMMRVIDKCQTCPQCRFPIEMLYFVSAPLSWDNFSFPSGEVRHPDSKKYGIKFTTDYTVKCYNSYMGHACQICSKSGPKKFFPTFAALKIHMNQAHQRIFCSICDQHLQSLSKNRVPYTANEMENHLKGTNNEASGQRGHPMCWICQNRFFDDDFLNRHLKSEHFFCQLCDNMGSIVSFGDTQELYVHYAVEHFPCDSRDCQHMGIVFSTEEELQVHKTDEHGFSFRNITSLFTGRSNQTVSRGALNSAQIESQPVASNQPSSSATVNTSAQSIRTSLLSIARTRPSASSQASNNPSVRTAILNMSERETQPSSSSSSSSRILRSSARNFLNNQSTQTAIANSSQTSSSSSRVLPRNILSNQSTQSAISNNSRTSSASRVLPSTRNIPSSRSTQTAISNNSQMSSSSSRVLRSSVNSSSNQSAQTATSNNSRTSSVSRISAPRTRAQTAAAPQTTTTAHPARTMRTPPPPIHFHSSPLSTSSDDRLMPPNNYGPPLERQRRLIFVYFIAAIFLVIIFLVVIKFISKKN